MPFEGTMFREKWIDPDRGKWRQSKVSFQSELLGKPALGSFHDVPQNMAMSTVKDASQSLYS